MSKYTQGAKLERVLANRLDEIGFVATRAAGSGTADRPQFDVVAIRGDWIVCFECKTYRVEGDDSDHTIVIDYQQFDEARDRVELVHDIGDIGRDLLCAVATKNVEGGLPKYVRPDGSVVRVSDGEPIYELFKELGDV